MHKQIIVTTSWDDGTLHDLKLKKLLDKYGLAGTFYVCSPKTIKHTITDVELINQNFLSAEQIKEIAQTQEIGSHTLNHADFKKINLSQAKTEIINSKKGLEQIINKSVNMFCYPRGYVNSKTISLVEQANYLGARTIKRFSITNKFNAWLMPTTLSVSVPATQRPQNIFTYFFLVKRLLQNIPRLLPLMIKAHISPADLNDWQIVAKKTFNYCLQHGGVWHLWGHAWDIDQHNLWPQLEEIFKYISHHPNVKYLDNAQVIKYLKKLE